MAIAINDISKAISLLSGYSGSNDYLIYLKNRVFAYKGKSLTDFETEYVLNNSCKEPLLLNKIVKIASWFGEKKKEEWQTEFVPEKILITHLLGETKDFYHAYVRYRKSQEKLVKVFIPKSAVLTDLFSSEWKNKEIDFEKYNKLGGITLKPHQENAIKFLTTRKKAILSTQMGGGKTISAIISALEGNYEKILVICPASIKTNWQNELSRFVSEDDITIVNGSEWKEAKFTIINYDILKNFYVVPKEARKFKEKNFTDSGKIEWSTVEKVVKTNRYDVVKDAMSNSQLFNSHFDLVIIDEAHRLSNKTSGMYEIVDDLLKRSNPDGVFELTGTMVTNSPINLYNILKLIGADVTLNWVEYVKKYCDGRQIFKNKKERDYYTNIFLKEKKKLTWYQLTQDEKNELDEYLAKNCKKIWLTSGASNLDELAERIKHLYYRDLNDSELKHISKEVKVIDYSLSNEEKSQYNGAWSDYIIEHMESDIDKLLRNHKLIEGSVFRQLLADFMVPRSIEIAEREIAQGNKVIIFCCFDKELYTLQEYFGDKCVVYNGKMTAKKKDQALKHFKEDENCKVFIGNLQSAGVGINVTEANVVIFNNISFLPAENQQAEYRILRIGQEKDCRIYYQKFSETYMDRMFEILDIKNNIISNVIFDESSK